MLLSTKSEKEPHKIQRIQLVRLRKGSIMCEEDWLSVAGLERLSSDQIGAGLQGWQVHV